MKEFSKEIIEIDGKEYTLFLNRQGIVAWEKYCKKENEKIQSLEEKYQNVLKNIDVETEITEETNPFEGIEGLDDDMNLISTSFRKLYWILLYTEHKLSISEASELYDKAVAEYGEEQVVALGQQMIAEANEELTANKNLKNLSALKPKK